MKLNAHTHLELSYASSLRPIYPIKNKRNRSDNSEVFVNWLINIIKYGLNPIDLETKKNAINYGISLLKKSGTSYVYDISTDGTSFEEIHNSGLSGIVFYEVLGLSEKRAGDKFADAIDFVTEFVASKVLKGISLHSPYSVNIDVAKEVASYCKKAEVPLMIHVAESYAEYELFTKGEGKLEHLEKVFGFPPIPKPGVSPIQYLSNIGALGENTYLVHCVEITDEDIEIIKSTQSKVVLCPQSNEYLGCNKAPIEKLQEQGIGILYGTDSLASCATLDVEKM